MHAANTTVNSNDQGGATVGNGLQRIIIQAIALIFALRNICFDFSAPALQINIEQGGRTDAIHIVIAINSDFFSRRKRAFNATHGLFHILEQKGVMEGT